MALKLFYQIIARCFSYLVDFKRFQELIIPISREETLQTTTVIRHLSWPSWGKQCNGYVFPDRKSIPVSMSFEHLDEKLNEFNSPPSPPITVANGLVQMIWLPKSYRGET